MNESTLVEVLKNRSSCAGKGVTFIEGGGHEEFMSYGKLYDSAINVLSNLQSAGVSPKDELLFQLQSNRDIVIVFWACILGGIIPVPLSIGKNEEHQHKLFRIWKVLNRPFLMIRDKDLGRSDDFAQKNGLQRVWSEMLTRRVDDGIFSGAQHSGMIQAVTGDDLAFVQFSSGSTGAPKGVIVKHRNLMSNMRGISHAAGYSADDSMLSWMPLTHDMGLIGFHINPLLAGMDQYIMATETFIRRPSLWFSKASEHKITILCSPNFGYKYLLKYKKDVEPAHWDLSHVRILYNGAEPISASLCTEFLDCLDKFGLPRHCMTPVYGLAEATLAVTISDISHEIIPISVDRLRLGPGDKVEERDHSSAAVFLNVGRVVAECSIRIVDGQNSIVEEGVIGYVHIKGDNVTSGYYNDEEESARSITPDGWLNTGDLGFIRKEELYITGRAKDILFVNGQNYYPHDLERVAEEVPGIELNKIVIGGGFNYTTQQDEIIAFVLHRGDPETFLPVGDAVKSIISRKCGIDLNAVIPARDIPRTTSGKLERYKLFRRYLAGDMEDVIARLRKLEGEQKTAVPWPEAAISDDESRLMKIWAAILQTEQLGVSDSFFDLGGNSLRAVEMIMRILVEFQTDIAVETIYENPTIRMIAALIRTGERRAYLPLPVTEPLERYPVSPMQRRIFYSWEIDKNATTYNIPFALKLEGVIDIERVERCLNGLIGKYDIFRTSFHRFGEPESIIHRELRIRLDHVLCEESELAEMLSRFVIPFDLNVLPLIRCRLLQTGSHTFFLAFDFHHIIADGLSVYRFIRELSGLTIGLELPSPVNQYADYVFWLREKMKSAEMQRQKQYWLEKLGTDLPLLDLPADFSRPSTISYKGSKKRFLLSMPVVRQLRQLARAHSCTLNVLMFTLYHLFLRKYTGQTDIIIGIPVAARKHPDLANMPGVLVNNLAIRSECNDEHTFLQRLESIRVIMMEALENQDYPFDDLVAALDVRRDAARNPVFDTMFVYQHVELPRTLGKDARVSRHFFDPCYSKFDLTMEVFDDGDTVEYYLEYASLLFKESTIARASACFNNLIDQVINDPNTKLSRLLLVTPAEYEEYIWKVNRTDASFPADRTIHRLFEEQVKRTPGNIAIEFGDRKITYRELNSAADRLALHLQEQGVIPNASVGVLCRRSPELIISLLGILKSGGCYLPLDYNLPEERIQTLIVESGSRVIVTDREDAAPGFDTARIVAVRDFDRLPAAVSSIEGGAGPTDLAYIIYTSGSSGKPKGVMVEHRALVNYASWAGEVYCKNETASFALHTSIAFDLTVTTIFPPLITGNTIIVYPDERGEPPLAKILADNKANILKLTPAHLKLILKNKALLSLSNSSIKRFIVGGENFPAELAKDIQGIFEKADMYNEYGPTEATVGCMIHKYSPGDNRLSVPIGLPAANTGIYVLDTSMNPVPQGVRGEIYISGVGIAKGYLHNESLTREKFLDDPWRKGNRMYRTGDLARWLDTGVLEYAGRADKQVKINGYRVEPAEIEYHLCTYAGITEALVTEIAISGNERYLAAYYKSPEKIEEAVLKRHLAGRIPYYMIPARFMRIGVIPLTSNGKIDLRALPVAAVEEDGYRRLPTNEVEEMIARIWGEVLGSPAPSITDNFFDFGGDSIKAVQIASRVRENGVFLQAGDILKYHTIQAVALLAKAGPIRTNTDTGPAGGEKPMTFADEWFFNLDLANPGYYHQTVLLKLNRPVDRRILEATFKRLIEVHDGLRVNYDPEKKLLYYNNDHLGNSFSVTAYFIHSDELEHRISRICKEQLKDTSLTDDLLIKAFLLTDNAGFETLFITAHHLLTDGISWRILLEDMYTIYDSLERTGASHFSRRPLFLSDQNRQLADPLSADWLAEKDVWRSIEETLFQLPLDMKTNDWRTLHRRIHSKRLDRHRTGILLREANAPYGTDIFILFNAGVALALKEWTNSSVFVVEHEGHGRHLAGIDLSRTIGWFTTFYPVKLQLGCNDTGGLIREIKEQIRSIPNRGMGYRMCKFPRPQDKEEGSGRPEIRINYLGEFGMELQNELFSYLSRPIAIDTDENNDLTAKLEINALIVNGEMTIAISYNGTAHKDATIAWFAGRILHYLDEIIEHTGSETGRYFTPSDLEAVSLSQEELNLLFE
jgi:surfactin family lipopeptide synthetase A